MGVKKIILSNFLQLPYSESTISASFFHQTEEALFLRSMKEVVMVWNRGTVFANLNFSVNGNADLQHPYRNKTVKQKKRDRERAAAHIAQKPAEPADAFQDHSDVLSDHAAAEPVVIDELVKTDHQAVPAPKVPQPAVPAVQPLSQQGVPHLQPSSSAQADPALPVLLPAIEVNAEMCSDKEYD